MLYRSIVMNIPINRAVSEHQTEHQLKLPDAVVLLDSLGDLQPQNKRPILVCGSHCGGNRNLATYVKHCHVKAVFLNNAGVGKEQAGIRGLAHYEAAGVAACAVDHNSAEIGIARDTYESGMISHTNSLAAAIGIRVGTSVKQVVGNILHHPALTQRAPDLTPSPVGETKDKESLKKWIQTQIDGITITVTDSITFLSEQSTGDIVVCGSHGGLSAGDYAKKHGVKAVFFNDAGIGKNDAGIKSLELLNESGIIACTVDCMSAEIFNGQDTLNNGKISACNQLAKDRNIQDKLPLKEAIKLI